MSITTGTPKNVLAYGELLWDLLPTGPVLGGAPANFAYRINSLGDRAVLASRLGRDELGRSAFDQIARLGMDTTQIQWDDQLPTGIVQVQVDGKGNPQFTIVPGVAYDALECTESLLRQAAQADCICFGTLVQRSPRSRETLQAVLRHAPDALRFLDINLRKDCYTRETILQSLEEADILKLNEDELTYVGELCRIPARDIAAFAEEAMRRWELSHVLVTLGERGACVIGKDGTSAYAPGYMVQLVDTCGSGDACAAGFLHGFLHGQSLNQSLDLGNALGALVATQRGATEPVSRQVIEALLREPKPRIRDSRAHSLGSEMAH